MKQMRKANREKDAGWALEVFDKATVGKSKL